MIETTPLFDGELSLLVGGVELADAADGLRFSTTDPGGFGECSFKLPCEDHTGPFHPSVARGADVLLTHDGHTLFEGIVTNEVGVGSVREGEASYDVAAAGKWYAASLREDATLMLCDSDLSQWQTSTRGQPNAFTIDSDGRLALVATAGRALNGGNGCSLYYWLHEGLSPESDAIDHIVFRLGDYEESGRGLDLALSSNFRVSIRSGDNPFGSLTQARLIEPPAQVAAGTIYRVPESPGESLPLPARCVDIRFWVNAASTPAADRYLVISEMYVMTSDAYIPLTSVVGSIMNELIDAARVTTAVAHGLHVGDRVYMYGTGVTAYNGIWTVQEVLSDTQFTIDTVSGHTASGGTLERLPSPVDAMAMIGEGIGGGAVVTDETSYRDSLSVPAVVRPYTSWASAMDELEQQFSVPQSWGWWDDGEYRQTSIVEPQTGYYEVDATHPLVEYDVRRLDEGNPDFVRVLYRLAYATGANAMRLRVTYEPSGGGTPQSITCPLVFDGRLRSAHNTYATALAGGANVDTVVDTEERMYLGQNRAAKSPRFRLHECFVEFDISVIPAGATVLAASLSSVIHTKVTGGSTFRMHAFHHSVARPFTAAAWRTPLQLAGSPMVATLNVRDAREGRRATWDSIGLATLIGGLLPTETYLRLALVSNRQANEVVPSGSEYASLWTDDGDAGPYPLTGQVVQTVVSADHVDTDTPEDGITPERVVVLDCSGITMSPADAQTIGEQYLRRIAQSGTITLALPWVDRQGDTAVRSAYIRAGEWIRETGVGELLHISATDYDVDDAVMTLTVGEDPDDWHERLARVEDLQDRR